MFFQPEAYPLGRYGVKHRSHNGERWGMFRKAKVLREILARRLWTPRRQDNRIEERAELVRLRRGRS